LDGAVLGKPTNRHLTVLSFHSVQTVNALGEKELLFYKKKAPRLGKQKNFCSASRGVKPQRADPHAQAPTHDLNNLR
jgi:hypothetical protein